MQSPLRIAILAPPWFDIPPTGYGGTESMCAELIGPLVEFGHEVFLISASKAGTSARHITTYDSLQWKRLGEPFPEVTHIATAARILDDLAVDIVHDHTLAGPLLARGRSVPTILTLHGQLGGEFGTYYREIGNTADLVAISDSQRASAPDLNWRATIYNAIRVDDYKFSARKEDFILFVGRCSIEKGMHIAIDIARSSGQKIKLAAKCNDPQEIEYFKSEIEPRLGSEVEWLGEVGGEEKKHLLANAKCLLFPIQWDEPFGMVMIEAMASGTPVVALNRGSVPEVIQDGVTGFICNSIKEFPSAIYRSDSLNPGLCRKNALAKFDSRVMAANYVDVYRDCISRSLARQQATRTSSSN